MHLCRVLFICTGNSARSILSEATLNLIGQGRFEAFSAGSQPAGRINTHTLNALAKSGIPSAGLSSKSWDQFVGDDTPPLDIVITVCDRAASEPCPVLFGNFVRAHWGLSDPAAVQGGADEIAAAFQQAHALILQHLNALIKLPVESMSAAELKSALDTIGTLTLDKSEHRA